MHLFRNRINNVDGPEMTYSGNFHTGRKGVLKFLIIIVIISAIITAYQFLNVFQYIPFLKTSSPHTTDLINTTTDDKKVNNARSYGDLKLDKKSDIFVLPSNIPLVGTSLQFVNGTFSDSIHVGRASTVINDGSITTTNGSLTIAPAGDIQFFSTKNTLTPEGTLTLADSLIADHIHTPIVYGSFKKGGDLTLYASTTDTKGNIYLNTKDSYINALGIFTGNGSALTSLNASNISSGTIANGRLSSDVTLLGSSIDLGSSEITNTLGSGNGGTGQSTWTTGDMMYASATNSLSKLGIGSSGQVLIVSGGIPTWSAVSFSTCPTCIVTNPSSTQTITPTSATAIGLSVAQASSGSVDVFNVINNTGSTKYLKVDSSGNTVLSGSLTLGSALAVASGGTGTTSSTGTGAVVLGTSPTIASPNFTGTIATTLTTSRAVFTDGSGNLAVSGASSALAASLTDETGTGHVVFDTSPTLVTPVLGSATATSINGLTITSSTGTLAIANSKIFTANNTLTFAGTDSTTITFQGTDTYVGRNTTDTLTNKTLTAPTISGTITGSGALTLALVSNTAAAFNTTDSTNGYFAIDTRTATSAVSALTLSTGTAPTLASGASVRFNSTSFTPGTVNFTGTTQITGTGTSANNAILFNQPTISNNNASGLTIDQASNLFINGPTIAANSSGITTITTAAALRIGAGSSLAGTGGVVTRGYGLYVDAPTGATTNYGAVIASGNVGIGTTTPTAKLDVNGNINLANTQAILFASKQALGGDTTNTYINITGSGSILYRDTNFNNLGAWQASGNFGVGTISPHFLISGVTSVASANAFALTNTNTTADTSTSVLRLNIGTATSDTNARFLEFYGGSTADNNGTRMGRIQLNNTGVAYNTGNADFAEYFEVAEKVENGDVIATTSKGNIKAKSTNQILGVVSDGAGFIGNAKVERPDDKHVIVGLVGQIKTKVSTQNGTIEPGDYLTASSIPGIAMKATKAGQTIGKALEGYSGGGIGKISVYVNVGYADPNSLLTDMTIDPNGNLVLSDRAVFAQPSTTATTQNSPLQILQGASNKISHLDVENLEFNNGKVNLDLSVLGELKAQGALTVTGPAEFKGKSFFRAIAEFFSDVIFHADVFFKGRPTFNSDTAGFALIKKGADSVDVTFDKEYVQTPVVSADIALDEFKKPDGSIENPKEVGKRILNSGYTHVITGKTTKGFTVVLNKPATEDITFSWTALAVQDAKTSVGDKPAGDTTPTTTNNSSPTAMPTPQVISSPIPKPSPILESSSSAILTSAN